jgi:hydroxymethylbilane synthase
MLAALDGSCRTPIAGFAEIEGDRLTIEGLLLNDDGSREIRDRSEGGIDDAARIGAELGKDLRGRAGPDFGLG